MSWPDYDAEDRAKRPTSDYILPCPVCNMPIERGETCDSTGCPCYGLSPVSNAAHDLASRYWAKRDGVPAARSHEQAEANLAAGWHPYYWGLSEDDMRRAGWAPLRVAAIMDLRREIGARSISPADALRQLDSQFADSSELRSAAYERQRARYSATTTPADALRWLGEHTAVNVHG